MFVLCPIFLWHLFQSFHTSGSKMTHQIHTLHVIHAISYMVFSEAMFSRGIFQTTDLKMTHQISTQHVIHAIFCMAFKISRLHSLCETILQVASSHIWLPGNVVLWLYVSSDQFSHCIFYNLLKIKITHSIPISYLHLSCHFRKSQYDFWVFWCMPY